MPAPSLTDKQARFVAEYLIDLNATQAATRAGYSAKTAEVQGPRLLGNVRVAAEIERRQKALAKKHDVTVDRILEELAKLGFANMADYFRVDADGSPRLDFGSLTRDQAAALQEVTVDEFIARTDETDADGKPIFAPARKVKFRLADKQAALVNLGKHLGMFRDRLEIGGEIVHRISQMSPEARQQRAIQLSEKATLLLPDDASS